MALKKEAAAEGTPMSKWLHIDVELKDQDQSDSFSKALDEAIAHEQLPATEFYQIEECDHDDGSHPQS